MKPTICEDCEHVQVDTRKKPPYLWTCSEHPCLEGFGFVSNTIWSRGEPFLRCRDVNGGLCKLYQPRMTVDDDRKDEDYGERE